MTIRKYSILRISGSRSFEKTKTISNGSVNKEIKIDYLIVGGGGGNIYGTAPAQDVTGGGGAGGVVYGSTWLKKFAPAGTAITIQVGAAGTAGSSTSTNGGDSYLGPITGYGGGGYASASSGSGGSGSSDGSSTQINYPEYNGTGYGSAGATISGFSGSAGGAGGIATGILLNITGVSDTYAIGGTYGSLPVYTGYGHGACAQKFNSPYLRNAFDGVVILRYPKEYPAAIATTGSPTVTIVDAYRIYKFTSSGSITF